jgi:hypothetical protein
MNQRFFKATPAVYAASLAALDEAWGFPKQGFDHCFVPVEYAPQSGGFAFLAITEADAEMEPAGEMLAGLIASGDVQEVTQADYVAAMPQL